MDNKTLEKIRKLLKDNNRELPSELLELQPFDQAKILLELSEQERKKLYEHLDNSTLASIIEELEYDMQAVFIKELGVKRAVAILNEMSSDEAADLLGELEEEEAEKLLSLMKQEEAEEVRGLLSYPEESAGSIMTTEYVAVKKGRTAEQTIELLRHSAPDAETIYYIYVVDDNDVLVGVLSLRDLIVAKPQTKIEDIMYEKVVSVRADMDQEDVATVIEKYDFLAVPVVDEKKHLLGIITVDDIFDVMIEETTEDIGQLSAISKLEMLDKGPVKSAANRLPWLIVLLFVGFLSANVINMYEETLAKVVILASFIPVITGMAGNSGTQSLTTVVRRLALFDEFSSKDIFDIIKRETFTGLIIGAACGLLIAIIAFFWQGNPILGLVVGISMWITQLLGTITGAIVPIAINRLHIDPAIASGPFITTMNDILGLALYFSISTFFMTRLITGA